MASEAWDRFEDSLALDFERWHDGIGIDLDALAALEGAERERAEARLLGAPALTWREVQGLAVLDTAAARAALRGVLAEGDDRETQLAVVRHAPGVLGPGELDAILVAGLGDAVIGGGLTSVLDLVEAHHPPAVLDALVARARDRPGEVAVHLAALADFLLGPATEAFDWDHRPLYLRFHAPPGSPERDEVWRELGARFGAASPSPG
ncbi:MAG TPA: hypothetical protein VGO60_11675 [Iamia sp.]|jgi:hypothetical protein|nr:hypothetical protein [Iamia sp.]